MSVVDTQGSLDIHREIAGARVLVTGIGASAGLDIARAFAEQGCRIVLQADTETPEVTAIGEVLSALARDIKMFPTPLDDGEAAVRFAQTAAQAYGGLEVVVNLVTFAPEDLAGRSSFADIEDLVSAKLLPMTLLSRVAANRMRLTMTEGLILNIVLMPSAPTPAIAMVGEIARAAVATLTRGEAAAWAGDAVRINAIAPPAAMNAANGRCLTSEADIAALALHLASKRGRRLSGIVFDAAGAADLLHGDAA